MSHFNSFNSTDINLKCLPDSVTSIVHRHSFPSLLRHRTSWLTLRTHQMFHPSLEQTLMSHPTITRVLLVWR